MKSKENNSRYHPYKRPEFGQQHKSTKINKFFTRESPRTREFCEIMSLRMESCFNGYNSGPVEGYYLPEGETGSNHPFSRGLRVTQDVGRDEPIAVSHAMTKFTEEEAEGIVTTRMIDAVGQCAIFTVTTKPIKKGETVYANYGYVPDTVPTSIRINIDGEMVYYTPHNIVGEIDGHTVCFGSTLDILYSDIRYRRRGIALTSINITDGQIERNGEIFLECGKTYHTSFKFVSFGKKLADETSEYISFQENKDEWRIRIKDLPAEDDIILDKKQGDKVEIQKPEFLRDWGAYQMINYEFNYLDNNGIPLHGALANHRKNANVHFQKVKWRKDNYDQGDMVMVGSPQQRPAVVIEPGSENVKIKFITKSLKDLVNKRVSVEWYLEDTKNRRWFKGTLTKGLKISIDSQKRIRYRYIIDYDDGTTNWIEFIRFPSQKKDEIITVEMESDNEEIDVVARCKFI